MLYSEKYLHNRKVKGKLKLLSRILNPGPTKVQELSGAIIEQWEERVNPEHENECQMMRVSESWQKCASNT